MVPALIRDSFLGRAIYIISGRRLLPYPEERPDFVLPARYDLKARDRLSTATSSRHPTTPLTPPHGRRSDAHTLVGVEHPEEKKRRDEDVEKQQRHSSTDGHPGGADNNFDVVDWYGPDDPECPMNVRFVQALILS
jgi:MFS transporter, DHA1 family, multidrug resistance protein